VVPLTVVGWNDATVPGSKKLPADLPVRMRTSALVLSSPEPDHRGGEDIISIKT
jgi:hypothetical protein